MADYATIDDIIALWRPLTPQEQEQLYRLLKRIAKTKGETV